MESADEFIPTDEAVLLGAPYYLSLRLGAFLGQNKKTLIKCIQILSLQGAGKFEMFTTVGHERGRLLKVELQRGLEDERESMILLVLPIICELLNYEELVDFHKELEEFNKAKWREEAEKNRVADMLI